MASPLFTLAEFLKHLLRRQNAHHLHSPFLFDFYNSVLSNKSASDSEHLLSLRRQLVENKAISFKDPKSHIIKKTNTRQLARSVASSHRFSYFLVRLIQHMKYTSVLETGTSLGINTSYLASLKQLKIWTLEGSEDIADAAQSNFDRLNLDNIQIIRGDVRATFEEAINKSQPDIIFLDADHRSETIAFYLEKIRVKSPNTQCIVIHDIYWSKDMKTSWQQIVSNQKYNLTIDLFEAGVIFPDYPMEKQHFTFGL